MTADTQQIARAVVPPVGWPLGNQRAGAWLRPGPDRDADDAQPPRRRPLPPGVEGHRVVDGRWGRRQGRFSTPNQTGARR